MQVHHRCVYRQKARKRFERQGTGADPHAPAFLLLRGWPSYTYTKTLTYPISGLISEKMDYPTNQIAGRRKKCARRMIRTPVLRPWMAKNIDMCVPSFVHRVGVVEAGWDSAYRPRRKSAHAFAFLSRDARFELRAWKRDRNRIHILTPCRPRGWIKEARRLQGCIRVRRNLITTM